MTKTLDEIKWGIIGCGDVTEVKSGPAFQKIAHSELVAVMRRDADKAQDYARRHGVPKWYGDADQLINDPDVNAVYIATPPSSHAEYVRRVARAGKPVYVEKPMARTYAECVQMIRDCRQAGVALFTAFYRRRLPPFMKVKELVESRVIGDIRFVNIQLQLAKQEDAQLPLSWRVLPEIAGGGHFFDLAPHQLDILQYIFGPVVKANGHAANQAGWWPAEDVVTASLVFESGVVGSGLWCFTIPPAYKRDQMEIVGSQGRILFSAFDWIPVRLEVQGQIQEFAFPPVNPIQQPFIQTIVDELRGVGKCPSDGENGARTNWVMDQIVGTIPA